MRFRRSRPVLLPQMNIISLVDVLFVLNLFFMLNAQYYSPRGLDVQLPAARSAAETLRSTLTLSLTRDGRIFLGAQAVEPGQLKQRLESVARQQPVVLRADRGCAYGAALSLFDLLRELGFTRLTLAAERPVVARERKESP